MAFFCGIPAHMQVIRLSQQRIADAVGALARAFHNQPFGIFYAPDPQERIRLLREQFTRLVKYCCAYGEPYTILGTVEGVALWMPPSAARVSPEHEREFGFDELPAMFGQEAFSRYQPVRNCLSAIHEREMKEPHWYLPILGVEPSRQGVGIGSALLQPIIGRAAAERLPCYLDTLQPRNVAFYHKHGFKVLVEGVEWVSRLPYWCFRRTPAPI
jgi:GNAT superfamily N-acetyltransferase